MTCRCTTCGARSPPTAPPTCISAAPRPSFLPFLATFSGGMRTSWPSCPRQMPSHSSSTREGSRSRLRSEIRRAKRYREPLSVLFLDVDGLKGINDRHGHRAGSDALREVATVIRAELRATDTAARWGGDEFTLIAPNTHQRRSCPVRRAHPRTHRRTSGSSGRPPRPSASPHSMARTRGASVRSARAVARCGRGDVRGQAARQEYRHRRTNVRRGRSRAVLASPRASRA